MTLLPTTMNSSNMSKDLFLPSTCANKEERLKEYIDSIIDESKSSYTPNIAEDSEEHLDKITTDKVIKNLLSRSASSKTKTEDVSGRNITIFYDKDGSKIGFVDYSKDTPNAIIGIGNVTYHDCDGDGNVDEQHFNAALPEQYWETINTKTANKESNILGNLIWQIKETCYASYQNNYYIQQVKNSPLAKLIKKLSTN